MKVEGVVKGQLVKILLDSGSSHNFVDSRLLKRLGWQSQTTFSRYNCEIDLFALPL